MVDPQDEGGPTEAELAGLVSALADAVVITDHDGRITFWNDSAQRLFGWTTRQAVGETLDLIIPERHRSRHWDGYTKTMATGRTSYGGRLLEVPALHRDGHTVSIAFTVTLLPAAGDRGVRSIAAVIRDDTERRQLEVRVRDLEQASAQENPVR